MSQLLGGKKDPKGHIIPQGRLCCILALAKPRPITAGSSGKLTTALTIACTHSSLGCGPRFVRLYPLCFSIYTTISSTSIYLLRSP